MSSIYLIDGYNLLHHTPKLRNLVRTDFEAARDALAAMVTIWCSASGHQAKIIFDGRGPLHESSTPPLSGKGVEIIYGPGHLTADTVIERMVYNTGQRQSYVVVTGDRGIRDLCQHMGAFVMTPAHFLTGLNETQTTMRETIEHKSSGNIKSLEDRLDSGTLAQLQELKDKLKDKG